MTIIHREAIGLGLRIPHYRHIFSEWPDVDFFEIISENFMGDAPLPKRNLDRILSRYPVVLHGVSLGIASADPLDFDYLRRLKTLAQTTAAPYFTDHLCWTSARGIHHHDLLPVPYTEENARYISDRISEVQDFIGLPFGLENLSSYVGFHESEMEEWEFYNLVVERAGCRYMLDINNVFVSSVNHGFDPRHYLGSIRWERVLQCHIAGHTEKPDGSILDTHEEAVRNEVWELYRYAWSLSGGFPTLLERDDKIPPFPELWAEAQRAQEIRARQ
ncbi:MAG: DUF692 domain-containing protein [Fibrobacterota bacterium]|nr:DUF692 domain-containing protein [Fibrobacterota bacterium]